MMPKALTLFCVALAFTCALAQQDYTDWFKTLVGPTQPTTLPQVPPPTSSSNFADGSNSRLCFILSNTAGNWLGMVHFLKTVGIPFKMVNKADYQTCFNHRVTLVYPDLMTTQEDPDGFTPTAGVQFASYVENGGTLIAFHMLHNNLKDTFGLGSWETDADFSFVVYDPSLPGPQSRLSDIKEIEPSMFDKWDNISYANNHWGYTLATSSPAVGIAKYKRFDTATRSHVLTNQYAVTLKQSGSGVAVAFGFDLGKLALLAERGDTEGFARSYSNEYEPSVDVHFRIIRYICEDYGEFVSVNVVPNDKQLAFMLTHDLDAQESYPNAVQYATSERNLMGTAGTFFIQTKYTSDYYDIGFLLRGKEWLQQVESLTGELASHSQTHAPDFEKFSLGTGTEFFKLEDSNNYYPQIACINPFNGSCPVDAQFGTYCDYGYGVLQLPRGTMCGWFNTTRGTVLGDLRVSKFLVDNLATAPCVSFRPGHLKYPPTLNQALLATGFKYSSINEANCALSHYPLHLTYDRDIFSEVDVFDFPITMDDLSGERMTNEVFPPNSTYPKGSMLYQSMQVADKIVKAGGGIYVILIHPTNYLDANFVDIPNTAITEKLAYQEALIEYVRPHAHFTTLRNYGNFWRARDRLSVDFVTEADGNKTIQLVAPLAISGLTLQIPSGWYYVASSPSANVSFNATSQTVVVRSEIQGAYNLSFSLVPPPTTEPEDSTAATTADQTTDVPATTAETQQPTNDGIVVTTSSDEQTFSSASVMTWGAFLCTIMVAIVSL